MIWTVNSILCVVLVHGLSSGPKVIQHAKKTVMTNAHGGTKGPDDARDLLTVRTTKDQVNHYCRNIGLFGNKQDFPVAERIYRASIENQPHSVFFAVGVKDGLSIKDLFSKPWWDKSKVTIFGWEAMQKTYDTAVQNLRGHAEVVLTHEGISDKDAEEHISGSGGTAGLYPAFGGRKDAGVVHTSRWDEFVKARGIPEVSYALVDVEGHEMPVVHGMNLEKLKTTFPVFQYELGGTWVDKRHAGPMTQADAAKYLESLGYSIFLMGADASNNPVLARMTPEAFSEAKCVQEGGKFFVQGNALAVLMDELPKKPWLEAVISEMLKRDKGH